jgi:hypothetical protein
VILSLDVIGVSLRFFKYGSFQLLVTWMILDVSVGPVGLLQSTIWALFDLYNWIMWNAPLLGRFGSQFLTITGGQCIVAPRCSRHRRGLHHPAGHGELKIGSPLNVTPAKHRPKDWQVHCQSLSKWKASWKWKRDHYLTPSKGEENTLFGNVAETYSSTRIDTNRQE